MNQDLKKEIRNLIGNLECLLDFECLKSGVEKACKAKDVGLKEYLECLEDDASHCSFLVSYGSVYFCSCPLRVHVCKKLGK